MPVEKYLLLYVVTRWFYDYAESNADGIYSIVHRHPFADAIRRIPHDSDTLTDAAQRHLYNS